MAVQKKVDVEDIEVDITTVDVDPFHVPGIATPAKPVRLIQAPKTTPEYTAASALRLGVAAVKEGRTVAQPDVEEQAKARARAEEQHRQRAARLQRKMANKLNLSASQRIPPIALPYVSERARKTLDIVCAQSENGHQDLNG